MVDFSLIMLTSHMKVFASVADPHVDQIQMIHLENLTNVMPLRLLQTRFLIKYSVNR